MIRSADTTPGAWRLDALCAETDPEAFFPEVGGSPAAALAVCRRCPVTAECLAFALENDERFGVWGGTSEKERRGWRRDGRAAGSAAEGASGERAA